MELSPLRGGAATEELPYLLGLDAGRHFEDATPRPLGLVRPLREIRIKIGVQLEFHEIRTFIQPQQSAARNGTTQTIKGREANYLHAPPKSDRLFSILILLRMQSHCYAARGYMAAVC
jgi:hypothetical protein